MSYIEILDKIKKELEEDEIVNIAFDSKSRAYSLIDDLLKEFDAKLISPENNHLMNRFEKSEENNKYVISLRIEYDKSCVLTDYSYMRVSNEDLANEYWGRFCEKILYYN